MCVCVCGVAAGMTNESGIKLRQPALPDKMSHNHNYRFIHHYLCRVCVVPRNFTRNIYIYCRAVSLNYRNTNGKYSSFNELRFYLYIYFVKKKINLASLLHLLTIFVSLSLIFLYEVISLYYVWFHFEIRNKVAYMYKLKAIICLNKKVSFKTYLRVSGGVFNMVS